MRFCCFYIYAKSLFANIYEPKFTYYCLLKLIVTGGLFSAYSVDWYPVYLDISEVLISTIHRFVLVSNVSDPYRLCKCISGLYTTPSCKFAIKHARFKSGQMCSREKFHSILRRNKKRAPNFNKEVTLA